MCSVEFIYMRMKLTRRRKRINRRRHHIQLGGIPVFAGAQGCVFKPALKCTHQPRNPNDGNISKLEQKESAESEMREYDQIKQHLKQIPNYQNYFSMNATLCEPDPLEPHDLVKFDDVCTNMHALNINSANVNANLSKLRMINMPDLGIDLKVWIEQAPFNAGRLRKLNDHVSIGWRHHPRTSDSRAPFYEQSGHVQPSLFHDGHFTRDMRTLLKIFEDHGHDRDHDPGTNERIHRRNLQKIHRTV